MRRVLFGAFIIPLMMFAACEKANNDDVKPVVDENGCSVHVTGKTVAIYLKESFAGFAVHLVQV